MAVVELFSGGGGVALGGRAAGLTGVHHVEWKDFACATLRAAGFDSVHQLDLSDFDAVRAWWAGIGGPVDYLWASPPCQDFSTGGSLRLKTSAASGLPTRRGASGDRNGWPWTLNVIDLVKPRVVLCENVIGLEYHEAGCDRRGAVAQCPGCYWEREVLPAFRDRFRWVVTQRICAADFGVPQSRVRVFLAASNEEGPPQWPFPTHGDGWAVSQRHVSIRDALEPLWAVLGPEARARGRLDLNHTNYDIVDLDKPSATIRAMGPAPVIHPIYPRGGRPAIPPDDPRSGRRLMDLDEMTVLQGFPLDHPFKGRTAAERHYQIGNAVPPILAEVLIRSVFLGERRQPVLGGPPRVIPPPVKRALPPPPRRVA